MAVDLGQLGQLLKTVYVGPLNKAIGDRVLLWNDLSSIGMKRVKIVGNEIFWGVLLQGAKGVGYRDANEFLPVGDANVVRQAKTSLSRFYATVDVDKMTTEIAGPSSSSFADYLTLQMQLIQDEAVFHLNRSIHGDGTGDIAHVSNTTAAGVAITTEHTNATTINLDHINGYSFGATQFLEDENTRVVFLNAAGAVIGARQVTGINFADQTVTLDQGITVATGNRMVLGDQFGHGGDKEPLGLRGIIKDSGDIFDISSTDYKRWKSRILNTSANEVPYNWDQAYRLVKTCTARGAKNPMILLHPAIAREHRRLYENDVRYAPTNVDFAKGQKTPAINVDGKMVKIIEDPYLGYQEMLCIEPGDMFKNVIRELSPDTDGGGKLKQSHGKDAYWAYWRMYYGIGATNLNRFARFDGVKVSSDYVKDLHENI